MTAKKTIIGATFMIFSRDRILTSHVGSLPRNEKLSDLLVRQEAGEKFDANYICGSAGNAALMAFTRALGRGRAGRISP